jgi:hypothetical protein
MRFVLFVTNFSFDEKFFIELKFSLVQSMNLYYKNTNQN